MSEHSRPSLSRRAFVAGTAAALGTTATAQTENSTEVEDEISAGVQRNISSFRSLDWQPYFQNLNNVFAQRIASTVAIAN